ncbi:MAG: alpha/beta hydrolase [Acetobacteraceae bacterium]|nr:alpha/beta hydrolase [Acetobacteraceae bacterium]
MTPQHLHRAGLFALRRPGTSLPLILLHGIGSDAQSWVRMMSALPPAIDVIAWNAPGYDSSAALANPSPTPDDYASSLAALLDALGMPRVVLAGHSLGTLFAARFAQRFPQRVAALALLSPALGYGIPPGEALPAAVQGRVDDLVRLGPTAFAATRAAKLVFQPDDKPDILAGVRRAMAAVRMPGYGQAVRALGAGTLLADVAQIAAPVLVAVGAEDAVTPPANAQATYGAAPNKHSFTLVPGAGHALPQEDPAAVARLLGALVMEAQHV